LSLALLMSRRCPTTAPEPSRGILTINDISTCGKEKTR
jgi:hypothetical protein